MILHVRIKYFYFFKVLLHRIALYIQWNRDNYYHFKGHVGSRSYKMLVAKSRTRIFKL